MNTLPHQQLQLQLQQQELQQQQQQQQQQQHTHQQREQQQQRNERFPDLEQHSLFAGTETPIDVNDQQRQLQQQQQRNRREEELAKLDERIQDAIQRRNSLEFTVLYPHSGCDDDQQDHFPSPNLTTATSPSSSAPSRDPQYQQQYNPNDQFNMDPKDLEAMIRHYCSRTVPKNNHYVQDITYDGCMNYGDDYDDVEKQQLKDKRKKHQHQRATHPGVQRVSLNNADDNVVPSIDSDSMILSKVEMKKKSSNKATVPSVMFVRTSNSSSPPSSSSSRKDNSTDSKTKQVQFQDPPKRTSIDSASLSSGTSSSSTASSVASINSQYFELLRQQQLRLVSTRRTQSIDQLEHDVRSKNNMMMTSSASGSRPRSILTNANDNSNSNWIVEDCDPTSSTFDLSSSTCSNNIFNDHSNASDERCDDNDDDSDSSWSDRMGDYINKASEDGGTLIVVQDRESNTLTLANTNTILSYGGSGNYKKLKPFDSKELVVAVEVNNKRHGSNTMDDEAKFTSAIQFDPQTEDQIVLVKKKMRTMFSIFFIVVMILIMIVIGVTAGLVVSRKKHIAASANINKGDVTTNTEDNKRKNDIYQLVSDQMNMNITELNIQYYPNRPYAQAIDWMVHSDPLQLIPTDALFLQRFVLVYLYYAATTMSKQQQEGPSYHPWSYCGPIVSMNGSFYYDSSHNATTSNEDGTTLSNLTAISTNYNDTSTTVFHTTVCPPPKLSVSTDDEDDVGIFYNFDSKRWLSQYDVCQWMGVYCDRSGHVHSLGLGALNVTGSFPEGIKNLPFLMRYANTVSSMNGPIPGLSIVLEFKHLTELQLQHNQLSGTFPQELIYSRNIQSLRLQSNKLIGSLPSNMNVWKDLKQFYVNSNTLSGPIPTAVGSLQSLTFLRLNDNKFYGRIPTEISMIPHLMRLQFEHNDLVGPIPKEIGTMTSLSHLSLGQNKLTGTIPIELYNLTSLALFDVQKNDLVGEISSEIGKLKKVVWLMLDGNRLNGTIPTEVGMLSRIKDALFYDNALTGIIPSKLCEIKPQNLEADCYGGHNGTLTPEIACPYGCCSKCCIASGATCHLMN